MCLPDTAVTVGHSRMSKSWSIKRRRGRACLIMLSQKDTEAEDRVHEDG